MSSADCSLSWRRPTKPASSSSLPTVADPLPSLRQGWPLVVTLERESASSDEAPLHAAAFHDALHAEFAPLSFTYQSTDPWSVYMLPSPHKIDQTRRLTDAAVIGESIRGTLQPPWPSHRADTLSVRFAPTWHFRDAEKVFVRLREHLVREASRILPSLCESEALSEWLHTGVQAGLVQAHIEASATDPRERQDNLAHLTEALSFDLLRLRDGFAAIPSTAVTHPDPVKNWQDLWSWGEYNVFEQTSRFLAYLRSDSRRFDELEAAFERSYTSDKCETSLLRACGWAHKGWWENRRSDPRPTTTDKRADYRCLMPDGSPCGGSEHEINQCKLFKARRTDSKARREEDPRVPPVVLHTAVERTAFLGACCAVRIVAAILPPSVSTEEAAPAAPAAPAAAVADGVPCLAVMATMKYLLPDKKHPQTQPTLGYDLIGGKRGIHEDPIDAALREFGEEFYQMSARNDPAALQAGLETLRGHLLPHGVFCNDERLHPWGPQAYPGGTLYLFLDMGHALRAALPRFAPLLTARHRRHVASTDEEIRNENIVCITPLTVGSDGAVCPSFRDGRHGFAWPHRDIVSPESELRMLASCFGGDLRRAFVAPATPSAPDLGEVGP